jgi:putative transposase
VRQARVAPGDPRSPGTPPPTPENRRLYPTDLSDAEWALPEPLPERRGNRGRPPRWPRRLVADAILYLLRPGCPWRLLPREYPPWRTVCTRFGRWRIGGTFQAAHEELRRAVRAAAGRAAEPSAAILDSQTVGTTGVGGPARGCDGAERAKGRERRLLADTPGLALLAHVHAADLPCRTGSAPRRCWASPGRARCRGSGWSGPTPPTPGPPRTG